MRHRGQNLGLGQGFLFQRPIFSSSSRLYRCIRSLTTTAVMRTRKSIAMAAMVIHKTGDLAESALRETSPMSTTSLLPGCQL